MTTDILKEAVKYSLGLVYNLVASLEIILQSSASPRVGQRPSSIYKWIPRKPSSHTQELWFSIQNSSFRNGFYKKLCSWNQITQAFPLQLGNKELWTNLITVTPNTH